jgi:hypothetical protein
MTAQVGKPGAYGMITAHVYAAGTGRRILETMYRDGPARLAPWQVETPAGACGREREVPAATPL